MKISKNSWHYNLNESVWDKMPTSLCGYFWKTVIAVAIMLALATIVGLFLFTIIAGWFMPHTSDWFSTCLLLWFLIIVGGLWIGGSEALAYLQEKIETKPPSEKKYIIWEYIKAIKKKICPLITYKD